jgi:hypothetical protein
MKPLKYVMLFISIAALGLLSGCYMPSNTNGHTLGIYGSDGKPVNPNNPWGN